MERPDEAAEARRDQVHREDHAEPAGDRRSEMQDALHRMPTKKLALDGTPRPTLGNVGMQAAPQEPLSSAPAGVATIVGSSRGEHATE